MIYHKSDLIFTTSNGNYGCTVNGNGKNVIIIFPELLEMLRSFNDSEAKAILAHEVGHIFYEHGSKYIDPVEAQVEADRYAVNLGLGYELSDFLERQVQTIEIRVRLTYITSAIFSN